MNRSVDLFFPLNRVRTRWYNGDATTSDGWREPCWIPCVGVSFCMWLWSWDWSTAISAADSLLNAFPSREQAFLWNGKGPVKIPAHLTHRAGKMNLFLKYMDQPVSIPSTQSWGFTFSRAMQRWESGFSLKYCSRPSCTRQRWEGVSFLPHGGSSRARIDRNGDPPDCRRRDKQPSQWRVSRWKACSSSSSTCFTNSMFQYSWVRASKAFRPWKWARRPWFFGNLITLLLYRYNIGMWSILIQIFSLLYRYSDD